MRRSATILLMLSCALSVRASAHAAKHPRHGELRVSAERIAIELYLEVPAREAAGMRRMFDRDRSGQIDGDEVRALSNYLGDRARARLGLRRDGGVLPFEQTVKVDGLDDPKASFLVHLTLVAPGGAGRYVLRDGGDATGHLPLAVLEDGVSVRVRGSAAARSPKGAAIYEVPGGVDVVFVVTPGEAKPRAR